MDIDDAREFMRTNHQAILHTFRKDGSPQMSPIAVAVDDEGFAVISSRETAVKTKNLARDPRAALCVLNDGFYGAWRFVTGTCEIVHLPDAMEGLVAYYRSVAGEHPDWDDYRAAMVRDQRVLLRISVEYAGPNVSG
jgi:PPOX class probable F420-dependent enzyme